jgi:hypothetical protein
MPSNISKIQTDNRVLNQIQDNVQRALQPLVTSPLSDGLILENVSLAVGSNSVTHPLGRAVKGWTTMRVRAAATFYDTQDSNPTPDKTLQITASAAATVDLFLI